MGLMLSDDSTTWTYGWSVAAVLLGMTSGVAAIFQQQHQATGRYRVRQLGKVLIALVIASGVVAIVLLNIAQDALAVEKLRSKELTDRLEGVQVRMQETQTRLDSTVEVNRQLSESLTSTAKELAAYGLKSTDERLLSILEENQRLRASIAGVSERLNHSDLNAPPAEIVAPIGDEKWRDGQITLALELESDASSFRTRPFPAHPMLSGSRMVLVEVVNIAPQYMSDVRMRLRERTDWWEFDNQMSVSFLSGAEVKIYGANTTSARYYVQADHVEVTSESVRDDFQRQALFRAHCLNPGVRITVRK